MQQQQRYVHPELPPETYSLPSFQVAILGAHTFTAFCLRLLQQQQLMALKNPHYSI